MPVAAGDRAGLLGDPGFLGLQGAHGAGLNLAVDLVGGQQATVHTEQALHWDAKKALILRQEGFDQVPISGTEFDELAAVIGTDPVQVVIEDI